MTDEKKNELVNAEDLEVEPLSDEALESVAGGEEANSSNGCCSCSSCSSETVAES